MKVRHLAASAVLAMCSLSPALAALSPMDESSLSQVHAAGLPDALLRDASATLPPPGFELNPLLQSAQDQGSALERQQALSQLKFNVGVVQNGLAAMQAASMLALLTPMAPLFLPMLALPLPFLLPTLPPQPPKKN